MRGPEAASPTYKVVLSDCFDLLAGLPDASVDLILTDRPTRG